MERGDQASSRKGIVPSHPLLKTIIFLQHECNEWFRMQTNSLYDYERIDD
jgi:hypothetical protein